MILTPHILVSAAIGAKFGPLGALISLIIHFFIDSLPHYEYKVPALEGKSNKFLASVSKVLADLLFGLLLTGALIWRHPDLNWIILAIFAGLLPDMLLFLHWRNPKNKLLGYAARFHFFCHCPIEKKSGPLGLIVESAVAVSGLIILMLV